MAPGKTSAAPFKRHVEWKGGSRMRRGKVCGGIPSKLGRSSPSLRSRCNRSRRDCPPSPSLSPRVGLTSRGVKTATAAKVVCPPPPPPPRTFAIYPSTESLCGPVGPFSEGCTIKCKLARREFLSQEFSSVDSSSSGDNNSNQSATPASFQVSTHPWVKRTFPNPGSVTKARPSPPPPGAPGGEKKRARASTAIRCPLGRGRRRRSCSS